MPNDFEELDPRLLPGGNAPPPDLKVGKELRESLETEQIELVTRKNELLQMALDFEADHPSVEDDETSGVLAGVIRQLLAHVKQVDAIRVNAKEPYLSGLRIIDAFFTGEIATPLQQAAQRLNQAQTSYQRAKEERRRREAEEAARKAAAEEEARRREAYRAEQERLRAERAARRAKDEAAIKAAQERAAAYLQRENEAREAEERASVERQQQQQIAAAPAAELSRVRGDFAQASLRETWAYTVEDLSKVPIEYLQINDAMVKAAIRGKQGARIISGLIIFPVRTAVNR